MKDYFVVEESDSKTSQSEKSVLAHPTHSVVHRMAQYCAPPRGLSRCQIHLCGKKILKARLANGDGSLDDRCREV